MNFKDIKQGYPLYIFDRSALCAKSVNITEVSLPHIDAKIGGPTNLVVDISTDDGNTFVMVADSDVAFPEGKVISTCVDHILREITSVRNTAQQSIDRVDNDRVVVERCNSLLAELDPAQREKQQTEARFAKIEEAQADMRKMQADMQKSQLEILDAIKKLAM